MTASMGIFDNTPKELPVEYKKDSEVRVIDELIGKTLIDVVVTDRQFIMYAGMGVKYTFYHSQDCCEDVRIDDICGDIKDLIGSPITEAEEVVSHVDPPSLPENKKGQDSFTWTFYKLSTRKGSVTIRWYGESNGYYSESVELSKTILPIEI